MVAGGAMRERTTIYGVAELAGVSVATVSRVVRGLPGVSERTAAAVRSAVEQLGYVPSGPAQGLANRRTGVLGLIFPDLDDPTTDAGHETLLYCDEVIRGAERAARSSGRAILIAATHRSSDPGLVTSVAAKVDGLVVLARSVGRSELKSLAAQLPVVLLAGRRSVTNADLVMADNEGGCHALTTHLIDHHRCRNVVFLGGPSDSPDGAARLAGFRRAMAEAGREVTRASVWRGDFTEAAGRRAALQLFGSDDFGSDDRGSDDRGSDGSGTEDRSTDGDVPAAGDGAGRAGVPLGGWPADREAVAGASAGGGRRRSDNGLHRHPSLGRSRPAAPQPDGVDGIVAGNDQMAIGAISALTDMGVSVPGDVAVGGFDDIQLSRLMSPALTTVRQPMRDLGRQSVELLVERLADPGGRRRSVTLPTQLLVRASCGCAAPWAYSQTTSPHVPPGTGEISGALTLLTN